MKAFKEIGLVRSIKFFISTFVLIIFKAMIFPQVRVIFLKLLGAKIGGNVILHNIKFFNLYRGNFRNLQIGNNCFVGEETMFDLADKIIIEENVTISERVLILTHINVGYQDHPLQKYFPAKTEPVRIRSGCFVGAGATILQGVEIGESSFVAAGSVVVENIPAFTLSAGVPAKAKRNLS